MPPTRLACEVLGHAWGADRIGLDGDGRVRWEQRCVRCFEVRPIQRLARYSHGSIPDDPFESLRFGEDRS